MRVALVHDWLVTHRGGENVLAAIAALFPDAPIYTLVHVPGSVDPELERHPITTSFIQELPGAPGRFRRYLPLFPAAAELWDLSGYDLIVSTSHCVAKGVRLAPGQPHLSYVHTPMRYLWDQMPHYLPRPWMAPAGALAAAPLRIWDRWTARRPTRLLTNSSYVAQRIRRVWDQRATVVYPPVDVGYFGPAPMGESSPPSPRHGYLVVSALVPYKRVELAVMAARQLGIPLTVIGDGPERNRLKALGGATTRFVGRADRATIREAYRRARALLFCGVEDFGIVPLEAMAAGCPVIALAEGGALETVAEGISGTFFSEPTVASLVRALKHFEAEGGPEAFEGQGIIAQAGRFGPERFRAQFVDQVRSLVPHWIPPSP